MVYLGPLGYVDRHTGRSEQCPACVSAGPDARTPSGVPLDEARRRVGETMHVDPELWSWEPDEIRWLAAEWRRAGAGTVPPADLVPVEPWPLSLFWSVVDGGRWLFEGSPLIVRVATALAMLFAYGYGYGRF